MKERLNIHQRHKRTRTHLQPVGLIIRTGRSNPFARWIGKWFPYYFYRAAYMCKTWFLYILYHFGLDVACPAAAGRTSLGADWLWHLLLCKSFTCFVGAYQWSALARSPPPAPICLSWTKSLPSIARLNRRVGCVAGLFIICTTCTGFSKQTTQSFVCRTNACRDFRNISRICRVDGLAGGGVNHVPIVGIVHLKNIQTIPFGDGIAQGFSLGTMFPVNRSVGNFRPNRQGPPARQNLSTWPVIGPCWLLYSICTEKWFNESV